jgi:hypothetical protein
MRRGAWLIVAMAATWACGGDSVDPGQPGAFAVPVSGALNRTYFYLNYVDEGAGAAIQDYTCGPKTYDGHLGTDITLPSFAVMDSGVNVLAAAEGTVVAVHDGEFDRQKSWVSGAMWNFVAIRHADGVQTIYGHVKKNSIVVTVDQAVQAGTVLGQVGSSGFSDIPHLHFEVRDANGTVIDPWMGSCGAGETRWTAQLGYQNAFSLFASGLTNTSNMTLDVAKDPPAQVDTFSTADGRVTMWVELFSVPAGTPAEFRLYRPDGTLHWRFPFTHQRFYSLSWWWGFHAISGSLSQPGRWRMEYRQTGALLAVRSFVLVAAPAAAQTAPPVVLLPRAGMGGGGVGRP